VKEGQKAAGRKGGKEPSQGGKTEEEKERDTRRVGEKARVECAGRCPSKSVQKRASKKRKKRMAPFFAK
jgi:hypothetical protein